MLFVYSPSIISGWDQLKARSSLKRIEGAPNCWIIVEIADGLWEHESGLRCGGHSTLLIPPDQRSCWRRRSPCHETLISFRGWRTEVDEPGTGPGTGDWWHPSGFCEEQAATLIRHNLRPIDSLWWKSTWHRQRANALLSLLLCNLNTLSEPSPETYWTNDEGIDQRVLNVEELARGRLTSWRTDDMAQAAGMSRSAFNRYYKSIRGFTPGFFLDQSRRHYAEAALTALDPDMNHIAHSIGFANQSDFARWFRRRFNCSPTDYNKALVQDK